MRRKLLEITDHYADLSLETRIETFLKEIVLHSLPDSVTVLYSCESLLPFAEDLKIITRCIEAITSAASNEELKRGLSRLTSSGSNSQWPTSRDYTQNPQSTKPMEAESDSWWGKELVVLNIHMFQRVVTAMKSKGLGHDIISRALMHYAKHSLEPYYSNHAHGSPQNPNQCRPRSTQVQIPGTPNPGRKGKEICSRNGSKFAPSADEKNPSELPFMASQGRHDAQRHGLFQNRTGKTIWQPPRSCRRR